MTEGRNAEPNASHPFGRTTRPTQNNTTDFASKYSWSISKRHDQAARMDAARLLIAGGRHGEPWQHHDRRELDMHRRLGGASVMLRRCARSCEAVKRYREVKRIVRELRLADIDMWYLKPAEKDGRDWGATEAVRVDGAIGVTSKAERSRTIKLWLRPRGMSGHVRPTASWAACRRR